MLDQRHCINAMQMFCVSWVKHNTILLGSRDIEYSQLGLKEIVYHCPQSIYKG